METNIKSNLEANMKPNMKTVLITGCSSGYGLETARHFHAQGWNVVATMRTPRDDVLPRSERLRVVALDVTKPERIAAALEASGPIDVLVNNAGIGLFGAFEVTPMATVREVFETNTFGMMAMTQAVLPQLRARRSGVVVNVTSSATLAPMPLVAVYTASKMAIEGFTGSLAFELAAFDVRGKLGDPRTHQALLIDSVFEQHWRDLALIRELDLSLLMTLETHVHADHVTGAWLMKEALGSQIAASKASGVAGCDRNLNDGDVLEV